MDTQELQKQIEGLKKDIDELKKRIRLVDEKRVFQQDLVPDAVKMRAMGEANRFVRAGTATNKPTVGEDATDSTAMYYDVTNHKLWVYDSGVWKYASFT